MTLKCTLWTGGAGPNATERALILDQCEAVGVKVQIDITALIDPVVGQNGDSPQPAPGRNSTQNWTALVSTVKELRSHPAVLGWCASTQQLHVLHAKLYRTSI